MVATYHPCVRMNECWAKKPTFGVKRIQEATGNTPTLLPFLSPPSPPLAAQRYDFSACYAMSSKLVKKQLSALVQQQGGQDAQGAAQVTKAKRLRQKKLQKKRKALGQAAAAKESAKQTLKNNLRYFRDSKKPSGLNQELMSKLLETAAAK